jgi:hypothetical protein
MGLSRTIPLKGYIFTTASLASVLAELSTYYRKSKEQFTHNHYRLHISEDPTTTASIDTPPKSFEALLNIPIRYISLRIDSYSPPRDVEFTLYHGRDSDHNSISLSSEDEDWVNLAHTRLSKLLESVDRQSTFLRRHFWWLFPILTVGIGWMLAKGFFWILLYFGQGKLVPWSWSVFGQYIVIAIIMGAGPAAWLLGYAAVAYPSVEIQTGPSRNWAEARRRKRIAVLLAIFIVGPFVNFLYDIYRASVGA